MASNIQENNSTLPPQLNHPITTDNNNNNNNNNINININNKNDNNKKRKYLEINQNSAFYKMRKILAELRPLILKAINAPDLDTCEARHEIQAKLKLLADQCERQKASLSNCNGSAKQADQKPSLPPRFNQPAQEKRFPAGNKIAKQVNENHGIPGSYVVGGSAFGWNFLMFNGSKPEYYGRTKEEFRAAQ